MQVSNQIEQLIQALTDLKPLLSEDKEANAKKFSEVLRSSLESASSSAKIKKEMIADSDQKMVDQVPYWVDPDYSYDPKNPRKPNMRELAEAISGEKVEDLYLGQNETWKNISHKCSEILYGVLGPNKDSRDWSAIMRSDNILTAAKEETGRMLEPRVQILSTFDDYGEVTDQVAVLKDKNENILREISPDLQVANDTLKTFGATHASVPTNLEDDVVMGRFDKNLLNFLKVFDRKVTTIEDIVFETTAESIAKKLPYENPLSNLDNL